MLKMKDLTFEDYFLATEEEMAEEANKDIKESVEKAYDYINAIKYNDLISLIATNYYEFTINSLRDYLGSKFSFFYDYACIDIDTKEKTIGRYEMVPQEGGDKVFKYEKKLSKEICEDIDEAIQEIIHFD